ncbi:MAG TPA: hypothetical protein VG895_02240 [Patescibacteria group bacterium]|nr:hypothetical protein [Patescibacteria group bacterium]
MEQTSKQVKIINYNRNPKGIGGLGEHPENITHNGRPKNYQSFTYWLNYFKSLTVSEFMAWKENDPDKRCVAADLAYLAIIKARNDLDAFKFVADKTEGKANFASVEPEKIITGIKVEIVDNTN